MKNYLLFRTQFFGSLQGKLIFVLKFEVHVLLYVLTFFLNSVYFMFFNPIDLSGPIALKLTFSSGYSKLDLKEIKKRL